MFGNRYLQHFNQHKYTHTHNKTQSKNKKSNSLESFWWKINFVQHAFELIYIFKDFSRTTNDWWFFAARINVICLWLCFVCIRESILLHHDWKKEMFMDEKTPWIEKYGLYSAKCRRDDQSLVFHRVIYTKLHYKKTIFQILVSLCHFYIWMRTLCGLVGTQ